MRYPWITLLCILPQLLHAGFANEAEDPRQGCQLPFAQLRPGFSDTELHLILSRPHVMTSNFSDRAVVPEEGLKRGLQKSLGIADLQEVVGIEPIPGTPCCLQSMRVYVEGETTPREVTFGTSLRRQSTHFVPRDGRIKKIEYCRDGQCTPGPESPGEFTEDKPPPGYRYVIRTNKAFFKSGLSGGHSRSAWEEALSLYSDQMEVTGQRQVKFRLRNRASSPLITATNITYRFGPADGRREVDVPKTIIESESDRENIISLELAIGSALHEMKEDVVRDKKRLVRVTLPVVSEPPGQEIHFRVALDENALRRGTLKANSWWVDESSFGAVK